MLNYRPVNTWTLKIYILIAAAINCMTHSMACKRKTTTDF